MLSVSLGPLAVPLTPLLLIAAVALASWLAGRLSANDTADAASALIFRASWGGLLAARLMHLAINLADYAQSPWAMLDLRDGGWHAGAGAATAALILLASTWRRAELRRPLAIACSAAVAAWGLGIATFGAKGAPPMPDLQLVALDDGAIVDLAQRPPGRPAVVNLWASWCGPCRQEMPDLAAAQRAHPGIDFLFVNQGEAAPAVRTYLDSQQLSLRGVLLDARSQFGAAVGSSGLPTTLFYDAQGHRVDAHFGVLNSAALASRLRALRNAH